MRLLSTVCLLLPLVQLSFGQPGCGMPMCASYRGYPAPQPQPYRAAYPQQNPQQVHLPQPQYYYTGGYAQPPTPSVLAQVDNDLTTSTPEENKATIYERYEQKLGELEPNTPIPIVSPPLNQTTYIRERYMPEPYLPRPMPYRPHPLIPAGCPVLPPQYLRPTPYMPRGYVTPIPYAPPPPPPAIPLPQPLQPQPLQPQPLPPFTLPTLPPLQPFSYPTPAPNLLGNFYRPLNDCCGRCGAPCRLKIHGTKTQEGKILSKSEKSQTIKKDAKCSSEPLRAIMEKSTTQTAALSKRLIQKKAEEDLGGLFSVFCSREDFSYVARSEVFCQTAVNDVICYAFQHN